MYANTIDCIQYAIKSIVNYSRSPFSLLLLLAIARYASDLWHYAGRTHLYTKRTRGKIGWSHSDIPSQIFSSKYGWG